MALLGVCATSILQHGPASGFDERAGGDRFSESDIAAFVRKPYEPEELVDAVRDALQG